MGVASREGILAALLAKQGAVSASTAMEGDAGFLRAFADTKEGAEAIPKELGKTWSIMTTGFNTWLGECDLVNGGCVGDEGLNIE